MLPPIARRQSPWRSVAEPMRQVVKLGGSYADSPQLPQVLDRLAGQAGRQLVIVPGGGPFADTVRHWQQRWRFADPVAHPMALAAMIQYGLMLTGLQPKLATADSLAAIESIWQQGRIPVWLPVELLDDRDAVEASWQVTSDSLALWLADRLGAEQLVLLKSVSAPPFDATVAELTRREIVDQAFAGFAARSQCEVYCLGPDQALCFDCECCPGTLITTR